MRVLKKSVWLSTVLLILISCVNIYAIAEVEVKEDISVKALKMFEIIDFDDEKALNEMQYVTRGMFSKMVSNLITQDNEKLREGDFIANDVFYDSLYAKDIKIMIDSGYMTGYGDGNFAPNDYITYEQAVKILVCAIGYEVVAKNKGGYPKGYLSVAQDKGLLKGISANVGTYLTPLNCTKLVYNTCEAEILTQTIFGEKNEYETEKSRNLLNENLNIYKYTGIVSATANNSISAVIPKIDTDDVVINDMVYKSNNIDFDMLLGNEITFYAKEKTHGEKQSVIWIMDNKTEGNILTVNAENLTDGCTLGEIKYTLLDQNKTAKISSDAIFIFNGRENNNLNNNVFKIESGKIRLIDNDGNKSYETVFIESYIDAIVDHIDKSGNIYLKYGEKSLPFGELSSSVKVDVFYKNELQIDKSEIRANDILSIGTDKFLYENNKNSIDTANSTYYKIYVSDTVISGTLNSIEKNKSTQITVDDKKYTLSKSYDILLNKNPAVVDINKLAVGAKGTFYLDVNGNVADYISGATDGESYGFIVDYGNDGKLDSKTQLKIFNMAGKVVTLSVGKNFEINEKRCKTNEEIEEELKNIHNDNLSDSEKIESRVVVYKTNDKNELTQLYTTKGIKNDAGNSLNMLHSLSSFTYSYDSSAFYVSNSDYFFVSRMNTMILSIPPLNELNNENLYNVKAFNGYPDGTKATVSAFSKGKKYKADLVISINSEQNIDDTAAIIPSVLVEKTFFGLDDEGEPVEKMVAWKYGVRTEFIAQDKNTFEDVQSGDVIRCAINSKGRVVKVDRYFRPEADPVPCIISDTSIRTMVVGRIYDKEDEVIVLSLDDDMQNPKNTKVFNLNGDEQIYVYDVNTKKISFAGVKEIRDYIHYPDDETIMYVHMRSWQLLGLVIYKY